MPADVRIDLGQRSYTVHIAPGCLGQVGGVVAALPGARRALAVTLAEDGSALHDYLESVRASLAETGLATDALALRIPPGETSEARKTLATASDLLDRLFALEPPVDRNTVLLAVGGGVTGDLVGFVAAVTLRGLRWVNVPTTLLADVDSSVGGKTGVDHPAGKNLIGAFHQPSAVLIDPLALRTLPKLELSAGLAECVKHAVIREPALLGDLHDRAEDLLAGTDGQLAFDAETLADLLARNVRIKAAIVAEDEREAGVRAHLNYGHTIGHAVEVCAGFDRLRHGQAVALGMIAENALAVQRGLLDRKVAQRIRTTLARLDLPTTCPGLDPRRIWQVMQHDKKNRGGKVRAVLARDLGEVELYDDITETQVATALKALDILT